MKLCDILDQTVRGGGQTVGNFFSRLIEEKVLPTIQNGRQAIEDLASLPERYKKLEESFDKSEQLVHTLESSLTDIEKSLAAEREETSILRSLVSDLELNLKEREDEANELANWVDEEHAQRRLEQARGSLLLTLLKVCAKRQREEDATTIDNLEYELKELVRNTELLRVLHERAVSQLKKNRDEFAQKQEEFNSSIDGFKEQLSAHDSKECEAKKKYDELTDKLNDLNTRYDELLGDVKTSTSAVIEKLVDKGMTATAILDLIPDVGGLFPQETVRSLESSIRKHNEEQAALLGLETLRKTPPPQPLMGPENEAWRLLQPDFYKRIFCE